MGTNDISIELNVKVVLFSRQIKSQGRGELLVSLCFQPAAGRLTVVLLKARNLPRMDVTGLADPYVKIYLLFNVSWESDLAQRIWLSFKLLSILTGPTNFKEKDTCEEENIESRLQW